VRALPKYCFDVLEAKKIRLIIDADAKCEADDQYAVVHAPKRTEEPS
jgi:hypothetical protein